jgi:hypothetical protein
MLSMQTRRPVVAMRASRKAVVVRAAQEPIKVGINGAFVGGCAAAVVAGRKGFREERGRRERNLFRQAPPPLLLPLRSARKHKGRALLLSNPLFARAADRSGRG